jgi:GTPase SAR1 family protein
MAETPRHIKVLILGDSCVGKSSIVKRLVGSARGEAEGASGGLFHMAYEETLGVEISTLELLGPRGEEVQIELWCCSGSLRYLPTVQQNALSAADLVALVYDATSLNSLQRCVFWRNEAQRMSGGQTGSLRAVLIGTKVDLADQVRVPEDGGLKQADAWGVPHLRVSSKDGAGFPALRRMLLDL